MCAVQLCSIFTEMFNWSVRTCHVLNLYKKSTLIPISKKPVITSLNDNRPVALTPVTLKVLEGLVLKYPKSLVLRTLDPFQFA